MAGHGSIIAEAAWGQVQIATCQVYEPVPGAKTCSNLAALVGSMAVLPVGWCVVLCCWHRRVVFYLPQEHVFVLETISLLTLCNALGFPLQNRLLV